MKQGPNILNKYSITIQISNYYTNVQIIYKPIAYCLFPILHIAYCLFPYIQILQRYAGGRADSVMPGGGPTALCLPSVDYA